MSEAQPPIRRTQVLVVDDSPTLRMLLVQSLRTLGYVVHEAGNGTEGLQVLEAQPGTEVVLTDLNMPVMDGITFIRRLRADPRFQSLPVILVSGATDKSEIRRAHDAGANGHLPKPFAPLDISKRLSALGLEPVDQ